MQSSRLWPWPSTTPPHLHLRYAWRQAFPRQPAGNKVHRNRPRHQSTAGQSHPGAFGAHPARCQRKQSDLLPDHRPNTLYGWTATRDPGRLPDWPARDDHLPRLSARRRRNRPVAHPGRRTHRDLNEGATSANQKSPGVPSLRPPRRTEGWEPTNPNRPNMSPSIEATSRLLNHSAYRYPFPHAQHAG
jgi:hypothetical protein